MMHIRTMISIMMLLAVSSLKSNSCSRSIYVPRQLSYNPILENAITFDFRANSDSNYVLSLKPIYMQNVGSKFERYFTINHDCSLNVQENGSGDISSLWFNVTSAPGTFYSSTLSFSPKKETYGSLIYFEALLHEKISLSLNTALINTRTNMHIHENNIKNLGTVAGYTTITQSFSNPARLFGRICGSHSKTGLDDIQVKLIFNPFTSEKGHGEIYVLGGIPTGKGSKAVNLFEPLVGSKHGQIGAGADLQWNITEADWGTWSIQAEAKYRYAFKNKEYRSFDLTQNGQWSRYMLLVTQADPYTTYPAINTLTFKTEVTPQSSFDFYLATHFEYSNWNIELGYDFWYRSDEKIQLCSPTIPDVGVADLLGIAIQNPQTASTANISQGIQPGTNQMVSDATFVALTAQAINQSSGAQASSFSNSFYVSVARAIDAENRTTLLGINAAYELGSSVNAPDAVMAWVNLDFYF